MKWKIDERILPWYRLRCNANDGNKERLKLTRLSRMLSSSYTSVVLCSEPACSTKIDELDRCWLLTAPFRKREVDPKEVSIEDLGPPRRGAIASDTADPV